MADGFAVDVDLAEIERAFKELGDQVKSPALAKALRFAARPWMTEAKRLVPVRFGFLRDSIKVRQRVRRGDVYIFVGVNKETAKTGTTRAGQEVKPWKYAHLVEFGTDPHPVDGSDYSSDHPGSGPKPFLRPAFERMQGEVQSRSIQALKKIINQLKEVPDNG